MNRSFILSFVWTTLLLIAYGSDRHVTLDLHFVLPVHNESLVATLSVPSYHDLTVYKVVRSVLHYGEIVMDCTFSFDTHTLQQHSPPPLMCDANTACISTTNNANQLQLHVENLGVGDVGIVEIKHASQSLFYDNLLCIGDASQCDGRRYIDFMFDDATQTFQVSTSKSERHRQLACDPKHISYDHLLREPTTLFAAPQQRHHDGGDRSVVEQHEIIGSSQRKILSVHHPYRSATVTQHSHSHSHSLCMDIILTLVLLLLIVFSVFNVSSAFTQLKFKNARRLIYDTRRV
eukprot:CAMPEP_0202687986 /NCGR_PEP_ID=MMETSP1385-20130828/3528_1 /ASSEMBLY_ACC=CAM_ASM_000861 /TAXON_ID=933848 /ORGANISM="Elphidium margaritaceum" /LENGTH=289 /DNA_ID=CAMNT_0049342855 /DNA_START=41 /DNA_END=910 /DNA_ORIENTATION=+